MATSPIQPATPTPTPAAESKEDAEYEKICKQHQELIETLPKGNGWMVQTLYNYNGIWLNPYFIKNLLLLNTFFKSQPSDIFLASFMKSGTTWLKALMFAVLNRHRYTASDHHLLRHHPQSTFPYLDSEYYPIPDFADSPPPRLFATHYPRHLLPPSTSSCKFVYVCRDPKDVLVSKWHFLCNKIRPKDLKPVTLEEAFELFCEGVSDYGPYWEHVLPYWKASLERPEENLFLKYEEIQARPVAEVRKLAAFMGVPFTAEEEERGEVEKIVELCSFEKLKGLEVNKSGVKVLGKLTVVEKADFFRKGEVGDWKNHLSEEMRKRIDGITDEKFKGSGLVLGARV